MAAGSTSNMPRVQTCTPPRLVAVPDATCHRRARRASPQSAGRPRDTRSRPAPSGDRTRPETVVPRRRDTRRDDPCCTTPAKASPRTLPRGHCGAITASPLDGSTPDAPDCRRCDTRIRDAGIAVELDTACLTAHGGAGRGRAGRLGRELRRARCPRTAAHGRPARLRHRADRARRAYVARGSDADPGPRDRVSRR